VDTTQHVVAGRKNSAAQQQKPYVILVSADGFRYHLADKYQAVNLRQLRRRGVAAKPITPSYPSLTFPNHYTLATGLYRWKPEGVATGASLTAAGFLYTIGYGKNDRHSWCRSRWPDSGQGIIAGRV
jgi:hypothetical protein